MSPLAGQQLVELAHRDSTSPVSPHRRLAGAVADKVQTGLGGYLGTVHLNGAQLVAQTQRVKVGERRI